MIDFDYYLLPLMAGALALVMASTYSRLRIFDLTSGFWAVLSAWLFSGVVFGNGDVSTAGIAIFCVILVSQISFAFFFASTISKNREIYTLFSFFLSLVIIVVTSVFIAPSHGSSLVRIDGGLVQYMLLLPVIVFVVSTRKVPAFAKTLLLPGMPRISLRDRLAFATLILGQILCWCILGIVFSNAHLGVIDSTEILSIVCVVAVAAVRPNNGHGVLIASLAAAAIILAANTLHPIMNVFFGGSMSLNVLPIVLLIGVTVIILQRYYHSGVMSGISQNANLIIVPHLRTSLLLLASIVGLLLLVQQLYPSASVTIGDSVVLLAYGVIVILVFNLFAVFTIIVPTLSFIWLAVANRIFDSATIELADIGLATVWSLIFVVGASLYFQFLRSQERSTAILIDLVFTFSLGEVLRSIPYLAGPENYISMATNSLFSFSRDTGYYGLVTILLSLLSVPIIFAFLERNYKGRIGYRDFFANALALLSPKSAALNGYSVRLHVLVASALLLIAAGSIASFQVVRSGGFGYEDYGLIIGLKTLAIGFAGYSRRTLVLPVLAAIVFGSLPLTPFLAGGQILNMLYGVLGVIVIIAIAILSSRRVVGQNV